MRIFGYHPLREALRHRPHEVEQVWIASGRRGKRRGEIEELAGRHGIRVSTAPPSVLAEVAESVHNGFVAELAGEAEESKGGDPNLLVLVEDVQDPRNLGALLRVCEGAGVGRVLIRDRGSAPITPTASKTSAGAAEWVEVERITNTAQTLERLKEEGYWIYGVAAGGDTSWEVDLKGKVVLCFGGEEKGLRSLTRKVCDRLVGLPMRGRVESLNLATAASAVLYEALRQRMG